ncbi:MAG: site-specific DNA-methyltransferase [candidate division WOR-3 bacterium]
MRSHRPPKVKDKGLKKVARGGQGFMARLFNASDKKRIISSLADKTNAPPETDERPSLSTFLDKIICGDSEEILKMIPSDSIDIIITSPPYQFGLEYKGISDALRWEDYFAKLGRIWAECERVLVPGGRIAVNVQPLFSDYVPTHHIISLQLMSLGLLWKAEILWEKHNYNAKYTAWGSWCSPSMPYIKYTWEFVEVFAKATHRKEGRREDIDIRPDEFKRWVYGRWEIAPDNRMAKLGHPAVFPQELVRRLLLLFSYRGDVVLDPFVGTGTTALVAKKTGRHYIGIDISEDYCRIAKERLADIG